MTDTVDATTCDDPGVDDAPDDDASWVGDGAGHDGCWSSDPTAGLCGDDDSTDDATDGPRDDSTDRPRDDGEACGDDIGPADSRDPTLAVVPGTDESLPFGSDGPGAETSEQALVPLPPTVAPAPPVSPFVGVLGLGGDTAAVLGTVSGRLADAGAITHAPLGSELDAALGRAELAGRASGSMAGLIHQQEIGDDVARHDQNRAAIADARRAEAAAERALESPSSTIGTFGGD